MPAPGRKGDRPPIVRCETHDVEPVFNGRCALDREPTQTDLPHAYWHERFIQLALNPAIDLEARGRPTLDGIRMRRCIWGQIVHAGSGIRPILWQDGCHAHPGRESPESIENLRWT